MKQAALAIFTMCFAGVASAQATARTEPNDGEQRAADQLRTIAETIRKCPSGHETIADGSGRIFDAPLNVVWDVQSRQGSSIYQIGYIEYVLRWVYVPRKLEPCEKRDKACQNHNQDIHDVDSLLESTNFPDNIRLEFDVAVTGLEFTRALKKRETEDATHWIATSLGSGCEAGAVTAALSGSSASTSIPNTEAHPASIPQELWDSATRSDADAQLIIANMYAAGTGVPQDYAEAYFWLDLAAAGKTEAMKPEDVVKLRDSMASHLTNTVLLQAQERARKWSENHPRLPN
jgi:hypothetical protein